MAAFVETAASHMQPLRWWSQVQLEQMASRLAGVRNDWLREWMDDAGSHSANLAPVRCRRADEVCEMPRSRLIRHPSVPQLWLSHAWARGALGAALLSMRPAAVGGGAATDVEDLAWADFLAGLASMQEDAEISAAVATDTIPAPHRRLWSGAVAAELALAGDISLRLYLGPALAGSLLSTSVDKCAVSSPVSASTVTPLNEALAGQKLRLQASLAPVEIALGTVAGLAPGDVVLLPHLLASPLRVTTIDGQAICHADLGRCGSQRALRIMHAGDDGNVLWI